MCFNVTILTLYPEMFPGPLMHSLAGRAHMQNIWTLKTQQIRDFTTDRHRTVDDTPAGGGAGMILKADILGRTIDSVHAGETDPRPLLLPSPRGIPLTQEMIRDFAQKPGLVIVCGHFEGIDQRIIDNRPIQEICVGDYILSGGEMASFILLDAIIRLLPGVMGNTNSSVHESFENNLLEYPHYTRPTCFEGTNIPPVLLSGHHQKIAEWRLEQAKKLTEKRRPDLWKRYKERNIS